MMGADGDKGEDGSTHCAMYKAQAPLPAMQ